MRQQWHLTGYVSTNKCAGIVRCRCYIFQLKRNINSQWQFLGCDATTFSERYVPVKYHTMNTQSLSQSPGADTTFPAAAVRGAFKF